MILSLPIVLLLRVAQCDAALRLPGRATNVKMGYNHFLVRCSRDT